MSFVVERENIMEAFVAHEKTHISLQSEYTKYRAILEKNDVKEFIAAMKTEFAKLSKQLHTIPCSKIMEHMGFGPTWEKFICVK